MNSKLTGSNFPFMLYKHFMVKLLVQKCAPAGRRCVPAALKCAPLRADGTKMRAPARRGARKSLQNCVFNAQTKKMLKKSVVIRVNL
jgi:hypothetical protein